MPTMRKQEANGCQATSLDFIKEIQETLLTATK